VQQAVHPDALTIFGATFDDTLDDEIRVTVIATGFDKPGAAQPVFTTVQPAVTVPQPAPEIQPLQEEDVPKIEESKEDDDFDAIFKIFSRRD